MSYQNQNALKILDEYKKYVFPVVLSYLKDANYPKVFKIPVKYAKINKLHWQMVSDYPLRQGKYLRPTLLILTAEALGINKQKAIKAAAGMQMSEEWLLVHDDLEDNSLYRRGKKTLHRIYGPELAINAGDALQALMWKILRDTRNDVGDKITNQLLQEFYTQLTRTTIGQTAEIVWTQKNKKSISDEDWFFIADGKTSYYTIACPMRLGAIIAKVGNSRLEKLAQFGIYLGRCFQLIDDILDVTSDFTGLKMQTGNDIYEGKKTVLLGHLLRNANKKDLKHLSSILEKSRDEKTKKEVKWVINKMQKYKSTEYAKVLAMKYKKKAQNMFEKDLKFLDRQPARKKLNALIDFILTRDH